MLRHYYTIVFVQIKHSVFDCKVRNQKRFDKVGLFRTDTPPSAKTEFKDTYKIPCWHYVDRGHFYFGQRGQWYFGL